MLIFSRYSWWAGAMIGFALLLAIATQAGVLHPVQGLFLTVTSPLSRALGSVARPVASFLSDAGNLDELQDENRRLRVENAELQRRIIELRQDSERVHELEQALGVLQAPGTETRVPARIVNRVSTPFDNAVSIDRGANDGVRPGMVVLSAQGSLLGTVTTTFPDASFVRLITDSRSRVNAQVLESRADGVVRGTPGRGLTFELVQAEVKAGDTIVTSGLGGNYPPGIPIGRASEVRGTAQDLFRSVGVEPTVRFSTATTVIVLTSFTPRRIDLDGQ